LRCGFGAAELGGHKNEADPKLRDIYDQFKSHYGATFSYERLQQIYPYLLNAVAPLNPQRPQAPLHFLIDVIEARLGTRRI